MMSSMIMNDFIKKQLTSLSHDCGFLSVLTVRHALRLNEECIMLADLTDGSVLLVLF